MDAIAYIRRVSDGVVRKYKTDWPDDGMVYMWEDGNYACDCNRHLFFHRAIGEEPEEDVPCGGSLYVVDAITLDSGEIVYAESSA